MIFQAKRAWIGCASVLVATLLACGPASTARAGEPRTSSAAANAADLEDITAAFPAGTLAIVAIPSVSTLETQLGASSLAKIVQEPEVQKFFDKPMAALRGAIGSAMPPSLDASVAKDLFTGSAAVAVTSVTLPKPGSADFPDIGLIAYAKASSAERLVTFRAALSDLAQSRGGAKSEHKKSGEVDVETLSFPGSPIPVLSAQVGPRFYVSTSASALDTVLSLAAGKGAPLTGDPTFRTVASKVGSDETPLVLTFVDVERIVTLFAPRMSPSLAAAFGKSGLSGLKAIGLGTTMKSGSFVDTSFVYCPSPRAGILRSVDGEPLDLSHLSQIPKDLTSFGMSRLQLGPIWDTAWDAIKAFDPAECEQWQKALAGVEQQLGFSIKADLLDSLGSELIDYSKPSATGFPEFLMFLELKNPAKFLDCAQKATAKLPNVKIKEVPVGESQKLYYLDLSQLGPAAMFVQPCYAISGNRLVLSLNLQSLKSTLATLQPTAASGGSGDKPRPSVRDNEAFKPLLAQVPPKVSRLKFTDSKQSFESLYNTVRSVLPMAAASMGGQLPFDLALLPTAESISKHLAPSLEYTVVDADGVRSRSTSTVSMNLALPPILVFGGLGAIVGARHELK
jgi:hypothetical protein